MELDMDFELMLSEIKLSGRPAHRDWPRLLGMIRSKLTQIADHPAVAADMKCRSIFEAMMTGGDVATLARQTDDLAHRVAGLIHAEGDELGWLLRGTANGTAKRRHKAVNEPDVEDTTAEQARGRRTQLLL